MHESRHFATLWDQWYQGANRIVTSDVDPSPMVACDIIRTQFKMLDAIVALHMGCEERLCPDKKAIRQVLEATP